MPEPPRRIQRQRTAGWRMPPGAVYVGRPSVWGNPYGASPAALIRCDDPAKAVKLFREMVAGECESLGRLPNYIASLRGRDLACWCRLDQPCHADVLLAVANSPGMTFPEPPEPARIEDARQVEMLPNA